MSTIDVPAAAQPREVFLPNPDLPVSGYRGRLRLALQLAGFVEHTNSYGERHSTRDGVWIRLTVPDDDLDVCLYPLQPGTPPQPSAICRWRASFGPGCPDEVILAAVNHAAGEDLRLLTDAERRQAARRA